MKFDPKIWRQHRALGGVASGPQGRCELLVRLCLLSLGVMGVMGAMGIAVPAHSASGGALPAVQPPGVVAASPNPPAALLELRSLAEPVGAEQVASPVDQVVLSYALREGEPLDRQLVAWAQREGWSLRWQVPVSWEAFSSFDVKAADVRQAIESVVQTLRQDGAPIQMHVFSNRVIVIESSAISQAGVAP